MTLTNSERLELLRYVKSELQKAMNDTVTVARFEKLERIRRKLEPCPPAIPDKSNMSYGHRDCQ